jgi:TldD protein
MSVSRRDFVKQSSSAMAVLALPLSSASGVIGTAMMQGNDPFAKQLCMLALDAARAAGAQYADARVVHTRREVVRVSGDRVESPDHVEDVGFGVRALVDGAWGYAAGPDIVRRQAFTLAQAAVDDARATTAGARRDVQLGPVHANPDGEWRSPVRIDPFSVDADEKAELLVRANTEAQRVSQVESVESVISSTRITTTFASTAGSLLEQTVYRTHPSMTVTVVAADGSDAVSRPSFDVAPRGLGYEYVEAVDLPGRAMGWAEEAAELLGAAPLVPGEYDLIVEPSALWSVIHETIGRATQLDLALGNGGGAAGVPFLAPPEQVIGAFRFGPEFMNVQGDRTQRGALATVGWDDEGVPADAWLIVKDGVLADYQTTREYAPLIAEHTGVEASHGCAYAESWRFAPLLRMPNVSLLPGEEELAVDDLVAATERGLLIRGAAGHDADPQGSRFRVAGHQCYEVRNGAIGGLLRGAAFGGATQAFWNSLDMLGGPETYSLGGTPHDLKGEPEQRSAVSHGCPVARFRGVRVDPVGE